MRSRNLNFAGTLSRRAGLFLSSLLIGTMCGCQTAHVKESVTAKFSANDPGGQLDFWHELATRPVTSNDDAFHGLLLDQDSGDKSTTYDQRVAALKSRGLLDKSFNEPADQAIERGVLAVAIVKILKIHGGLMMHIVGPTQRYALRELIYQGIFPESSVQQTFSGSEFVGIIGKLDDYQQPVAENVPSR